MKPDKERTIDRINMVADAIDEMTYAEWKEVRKAINVIYHKHEYEYKKGIRLSLDDVEAIQIDLRNRLLE